MPIPTRRLALVAVLASIVVIAFDSGWGFLAVEAALVLAALIDWALASRPASIEIARDLPEVLVLNTTGTITWTVTNSTGRRQRLARRR